MTASAIATKPHVDILGPRGEVLNPRRAGPRSLNAQARVAFQMGIRAGFDAAKTTNANYRHWTQADALSADAAGNSGVRRILRNRARYEIANNSYAKGIVLTIANFCIGCGPTLQVLSEDEDANTIVERSWERWARATRYAAKLRTMRMAQCGDGEAFGLFVENPRLRHKVRLDIVLIEADRVTEPSPRPNEARNCDGVIIDELGNPVEYRILKEHPGGPGSVIPAAEPYSADQVLHAFRRDRPEQHRGITEICPSLPLFQQLRDYGWAVGEAAKQAAQQSGWLYTENAAEDAAEGEAFDAVEIDLNTWNVAPYGYKAMQVKAEQPTTTHDAFVAAKIAEIARCQNMPYNIAAGNSGRSNMASARLDCQLFYRQLDVDRMDTEIAVCGPTVERWLMEAYLAGVLPAGMDPDVSHRLMWPPYPEPDPEVEAKAFEIRRRNGADTISRHYSRRGEDWRPQLEQWTKETDIVPIPGASPDAKEGQTQEAEQQGEEA